MKRARYIIILLVLTLAVFICAACGTKGSENSAWPGEGPAESDLLISPVEGLPLDFIRGADVSSLLALEASGTVFFDCDGNERDMLSTLSLSGFNYIRVRVWNDPYDAYGNGYGGGSCDISAALALGVRAAEYGMKTLVNFHYSDFWADPAKQQAPKAWAGMDIDEKVTAIYDYTADSLNTLIDGGADVGMVQIGNETTGAFCGETAWPRIGPLMASAAKAVRDTAAARDLQIQIAAHWTNPESRDFVQAARLLEVNNVDYDVFASSYYPFWHGSLENLAAQLGAVASQFDKKVMVAEIAYAYSWEDFDGHANTIGEGAVFEKPYPLTVQGQARAIRDVVEAVASLGDAALGVFYWEPGWIPVPGASWEERSALWERYGSGWASSYAAEYDPDDAGLWFGGSACDNQALFDATGHPLPSLKVFTYCYIGSVTERRLDEVSNAYISVRLTNPITLPQYVTAIFNDGTVEDVPVIWDATVQELSDISESPVGVYAVSGTAQGLSVTCYVSMEEENYLDNHSFEDDDRTMWVFDNIGDTEQLRFQEKTTDAKSGRFAVHFWDASYVEFTIEQSVSGLRPGSYNFAVFLQGGDTADDEIYIYARADGEEYRADTFVDGWVNWQQPVIEGIVTSSGEITVGVYVRSNGGWGTIDDFMLNPAE
ncbi:MAG: glycosyl hydrolase 53 family protein [Oscillospiraceae bacterium]|nr:glycosyl hydrolase 53 family protein [Oscillospiraceae bacterium]